MIHTDLINNVFPVKRQLSLSPLSAIKIWAFQYSLIWQICNECLFYLWQAQMGWALRTGKRIKHPSSHPELTVQKGRQTCKLIPVEWQCCLKGKKNRKGRNGYFFSSSWFKCKIITHFQFEVAKKMEKQAKSYYVSKIYLWLAINNHTDSVCQAHSWALEMTQKSTAEEFQTPWGNKIYGGKTATTTSTLEVF